jgi:hypothetical protein
MRFHRGVCDTYVSLQDLSSCSDCGPPGSGGWFSKGSGSDRCVIRSTWSTMLTTLAGTSFGRKTVIWRVSAATRVDVLTSHLVTGRCHTKREPRMRVGAEGRCHAVCCGSVGRPGCTPATSTIGTGGELLYRRSKPELSTRNLPACAFHDKSWHGAFHQQFPATWHLPPLRSAKRR